MARIFLVLTYLGLVACFISGLESSPDFLHTGLSGGVGTPPWWPHGQLGTILRSAFLGLFWYFSSSMVVPVVFIALRGQSSGRVMDVVILFFASTFILLFGLPRGWGWLGMSLVVIVGAIVAVKLILRRRLSLPPSPQGDYQEAQRIQQALLRDHFPTRPRPFELAERLDAQTLRRLEADPRMAEAHALYLKAVEMDQRVNYGKDFRQQTLNLGTAHNELMGLHRMREELDDALIQGRKAIEVLSSLADDSPGDKELLFALSVAYFRFGETNHVVGNREVAKDAYERGLAIDQQLGDTEGQNMYRRLMARLG